MSQPSTDNTIRPGRLRVGAVAYLNTKPLVFGLEKLADEIELSFDYPSCLADGLKEGALDVALVPSIERLLHPEYQVVSDACIACRGPVLSVKLLSRVPLPEIKTLALDVGSRTSVALVQILLAKQFGVTPRCRPLPIGMPAEKVPVDAVLLIGDRAIHPPSDGFVEHWDLGEQWCRWSRLPFVFAAWIARPGVPLGNVTESLEAARDAGLANLRQIAEREAASVDLDVEACHSYLRDNLHFYFGPDEQRGIEKFFQYATELGFASPNCALSQR